MTAGSGRIVRVTGPLVEVEHTGNVAMYDLIALGPNGIPGEIVAVRDGRVTAQAYEYTGGLAPGEPARPQGRPLTARLGPGLLGHVFDGLLRPLSDAPAFLASNASGPETGASRSWRFEPRADVGLPLAAGALLGVLGDDSPLEYRVLVPPGVEGPLVSIRPAGMYSDDTTVARVGDFDVGLWIEWPIRQSKPYRARRESVEPLPTGQRAIDLLFPIARGGSAAVPGGFGTGKTVLLQQLAKWCHADVIVYVGCGERGNEMADVVAELMELEDPRTGGRLADRTVVIANTSNMPMMGREASIYTGVTVAEHFRDMGYDTVVIADSTSRWAEAQREYASRSGALPAEEGYPADLASALAAFYERAGAVETLFGEPGSVTIVGAVSPPGGDLTEPVTAYTERFVRCRWTLDAELAYARHYPAVSWSGSFCRDADAVGRWQSRNGDPAWLDRRIRLLALLAEADRLSALAELVGLEALPGHERMVILGGRLVREAVLQQSALSAQDAYCEPVKAAALAESVLTVVDACQRAVRSGAPATILEAVDFSALIRAREDTGPDEVEGVRQRLDAVVAEIQELA
ncbi:MAG: V-type ATP synthase subunit A [Nocardioidaceae bacterium]